MQGGSARVVPRKWCTSHNGCHISLPDMLTLVRRKLATELQALQVRHHRLTAL